MKQINRTKQTGASMIAIIIFLIAIIFSLNFLGRILSLHYDDYMLATSLEDLSSELNDNSNERDVVRLINERLDMNRLRMISKDKLSIKPRKGKLELVWTYERREHVMWNVDIVATFNHEYSY